MRFLLTPALAILLAACSGADSAARLGYRTAFDTVGDTVFARTTGTLPDSLVRRLVLEWQADTTSGDSVVRIGDVSEIAVGGDGRLFVWDPATPGLWMVEPNGQGMRLITRPGGGPGEVRTANGLAVGPDGSIVLWDAGNSRLNVYNRDGTFRWSSLVPFFECCPSNGIVIDSSGRRWLRALLNAPTKDKPPDLTTLGREWTAWFRFDSTGVLRDTVPVTPLPGDYPPIVAINNTATGTTMAANIIPYGPHTTSAVSRHGYLVTGQGRPYVLYSRAGGRVLRIERELAPVPVSQEERDQERASLEARMRKVKPDWTWDAPPIPADKPAFRDLQVDDDGRIWVVLNVASEEYEPDPPSSNQWEAPPVGFRDAESRWDTFAPDGRFLGTVVASRLFEAHRMRGNTVWGVLRDENDVPTVVKMRIEPGL